MTTDIAIHYDHEPFEDEDYDKGSARLFERSRIRALADERENVQKKTFSKWVNSHLIRVGGRVQDLYIDLRDGKLLIKLLEVLSGERLPRPTKGKMRIHCLENVDKALTFLKEQYVHLENMGSHDIVDGNPRLTLGLIWTIILRFQIQDITFEEAESKETKSAKDALLLWCQMKTAGYPNVNVRNFTTSWRDGLAFNALIHKHRPDLIKYEALHKSNAVVNLNNAFNVADDKLGIPRLLDTEDVNVELPDEKSIITYVVTYYHYFSKMRAETVQGKRIAKVVDAAMEQEKMLDQYEKMSSNLLDWIEKTVEKLGERNFANSLIGVQQQLAAFNSYRTQEKPPKFIEKGNLEIILFTMQSKARAMNLKPRFPREGKMISDINKSWDQLETAEHEREMALREEILRQEKLEQLADKFDRKAGMRETWLNENQRLVSQDNFGHELASCEAAMKKHEAIETDIFAYKERINALVKTAAQLKAESYHDIRRIQERKENVIRLWKYLLELLKNRRKRLEKCIDIQTIFQNMIHKLDIMEELKSQLLSEDYGKHLMGVEDLLQKHNLNENDIDILGQQLRQENEKAKAYIDDDGKELGGYRPCDPKIIEERVAGVDAAYDELVELSNKRKRRLEASKKLWEFYWEVSQEENWIREKEALLTSPDVGHDLTSVNMLINKQKALEGELESHEAQLRRVVELGSALVRSNSVSDPVYLDSTPISARCHDLEILWNCVTKDACARRRARLARASDFYSWFAEADDCDAYQLETLRVLSASTTGTEDESGVQAQLKKHASVAEGLKQFASTVEALREQALALDLQDRDAPEVLERIKSIEWRYQELLELSKLRKQRLLDALSLYKLYNEVDGVQAWIEEKEKMLYSVVPTKDDIEALEVMKHRFDSFEQEMNNSASRVACVNQLARQLLQVDHPNSDEILAKQTELNKKWSKLRDVVDKKKSDLDNAYGVQTFHLECQETISWILDKTKALEETEEFGNDLGSVMKLQRRLSLMERDLNAIKAKMDSLENEAQDMEQQQAKQVQQPPAAESTARSTALKKDLSAMRVTWDRLAELVRARDAKLAEHGDLQRFLADVDHFQSWLGSTQRAVASGDAPNSLAQAENLLAKHRAIRDDIDSRAADRDNMVRMGKRVTEGQTDPQYMFLRERLNALDSGWNELLDMWDNRQRFLSDNLNYQIYTRDAKQVEQLLNQEDRFLTTLEEAPVTSLDQIESLIKEIDMYKPNMDVGAEKMATLFSFAEKLTATDQDLQIGSAVDVVLPKAEVLNKRLESNRNRLSQKLSELKDLKELHILLKQMSDLGEWVSDKVRVARDDTYRDSKTAHSKWTRHQVFAAEVRANRDRLDDVKKACENFTKIYPGYKNIVDDSFDGLQKDWNELERATKRKGSKIFETNKKVIYEQTCQDIDQWTQELEDRVIPSQDFGRDLTSVNILLRQQDEIEKQMDQKKYQIQELQLARSSDRDDYPPIRESIAIEEDESILETVSPISAVPIPQLAYSVVDSGRTDISEGHATSSVSTPVVVQESMRRKFKTLEGPLLERKMRLQKQKDIFQFQRDVEDEKLWLDEKFPQASSDNYGNSLVSVQGLQKKNQTLRSEVNGHEPRIMSLCERGRELKNAIPEKAEEFQELVNELMDKLNELKDNINNRDKKLSVSLQAQQYYYDVSEAEAWMSEQELYMITGERGKDNSSVANLLKKHSNTEHLIDNYADTIRDLGDRAEKFIQQNHPQSDQIAIKQHQMEKLYAGLKEMAWERRADLNKSTSLHELSRDIEDVEQWIIDREMVASSHELGQDYEQITRLRDRFSDFSRETERVGSEKVGTVIRACDTLIHESQKFETSAGREGSRRELEAEDAARVALWKDYISDKWEDLQELLATRADLLDAARNLHKYHYDSRELLALIAEKKNSMSEELGRDVSSVSMLQRKHFGFEKDLESLDFQVQNISDKCSDLRVRYAGEKAKNIVDREMEVVSAWNTLKAMVQGRKLKLDDTAQLFKFFNSSRDLVAWMADVEKQMKTTKKPKDVSGVELLMNGHQALKAEIESRDETFSSFFDLGRDLINRKHYASSEIKRKMEEVNGLRNSLIEKWEHRWEYLQLILEVYQFARDAAIADTWLFTQEPYVLRSELGNSLDEVDKLLRKHDAFEKSLNAQEDRFAALERLTTLEIREAQRKLEKERLLKSQHEKQRDSQLKKQGDVNLLDTSGETEHTPDISITDGEKLRVVDISGAHREKILSPSYYGDQKLLESHLIRKCVWLSTTKKSAHRSWEKVYAVLQKGHLHFYKDQKYYRQEPNIYYHDENPLSLNGASCEIANDYTKRKNVFRLKFPNGAEYLFQARDEDEMHIWIKELNYDISDSGAGSPSGLRTSKTLPTTASSNLQQSSSSGTEDPNTTFASTSSSSQYNAAANAKKRGFFTLKKK
ncbi:unnamed protein product [Gordionus sp. m RMFG-2023]|uniref:spectrin beta chain-like isoform X2 n=1 Tax=Gordionus sp. m RMFG-2023 TaxID=3053472 RepID=UPI0030E2672E